MYTAIDRSDAIPIDDRVALCGGLGRVLAALPDDQRMSAFKVMASLPLGRLERLTRVGKNAQSYSELSPTLPHVGDEIRTLSALSLSFSVSLGDDGNGMDVTCEKESTAKLSPVSEGVLNTVQLGWPSIAHAAANWADDEVCLVEI